MKLSDDQRASCAQKKKKKKRSLLKQLKVFLSQTEAEDLFLLITTCKNHKIHRGLINISIVSIVVKIYSLKKKTLEVFCLFVFLDHIPFLLLQFFQTLEVINLLISTTQGGWKRKGNMKWSGNIREGRIHARTEATTDGLVWKTVTHNLKRHIFASRRDDRN